MKYALMIAAVALAAVTGWSQHSSRVSGRHPAIRYETSEVHDPVAALNQKLANGAARLNFDNTFGYLQPVLEALQVPVESQILVFSKTSLQSLLISPDNPRAIFFNDAVAAAWVRGGPVLEVIAQDPQLGAVFYTLAQDRQNRPLLSSESVCLSCHQTPDSLDVPGMVVRTVFPGMTGAAVTGLTGSASDHRTPFDARWGGWYVTGKQGPLRHLANAVVSGVRRQEDIPAAPAAHREPLPVKFDATGYLTSTSDVVALSVFEHQMHMMN